MAGNVWSLELGEQHSNVLKEIRLPTQLSGELTREYLAEFTLKHWKCHHQKPLCETFVEDKNYQNIFTFHFEGNSQQRTSQNLLLPCGQNGKIWGKWQKVVHSWLLYTCSKSSDYWGCLVPGLRALSLVLSHSHSCPLDWGPTRNTSLLLVQQSRTCFAF